MKTAEEILIETFKSQPDQWDQIRLPLYTRQRQIVIEAMKAYARAALEKAAEGAKIKSVEDKSDGRPYPIYEVVVDKSSITNIELK